MKQISSYLLIGLFIILVQTALLPHLISTQLRPDLVLILVLHISLKAKSCNAAIYAWSLGCLLDVFSGTTLGLYGITMLVIFYATMTISQQLSYDNNTALFFATILATIGQNILLVIILLSFSETNHSWLPIIQQLPKQLMVNLLAVGIISVVLQPLKRWKKHQKLHHAEQRNRASWH
jgi:rod shape-determining protein MreD